MLGPKDFLAQECENIERLLYEALRFEYGAGESEEFYAECRYRLTALQALVDLATTNSDIASVSTEVSALSALLTRIERSHLGEFPWAFGNALKNLATLVCKASAAESPGHDPLFFLSADGGLFAYRIHPEQSDTAGFRKRIFNIVFPRSFKTHVLLHSILAHEVGHAAWSVPSFYKRLRKEMLPDLIQDSALVDVESFRQWFIENPEAGDEFMEVVRKNWEEELFCDLFGLVLFGPSFLAAHYCLLSAIDPTGLTPGQNHPPCLHRYAAVRTAYRHLGWHQPIPDLSPSAAEAFRAFNAVYVDPDAPGDGVPNLLHEDGVRKATTKLKQLLDEAGVTFTLPSASLVDDLRKCILNATPPIGPTIAGDGQVTSTIVDSRHILFAGWLAFYSGERNRSTITFYNVNRLCNHAIVQQEAIGLWQANAPAGKSM